MNLHHCRLLFGQASFEVLPFNLAQFRFEEPPISIDVAPVCPQTSDSFLSHPHPLDRPCVVIQIATQAAVLRRATEIRIIRKASPPLLGLSETSTRQLRSCHNGPSGSSRIFLVSSIAAACAAVMSGSSSPMSSKMEMPL